MNPEVIVIYRISDHSNPQKIKPLYASKENCLKVLVREFGSDNLYIIGDNIKESTHKMLLQYSPNVECTNKGNTGTFLHSWNKAYDVVQNMPKETIVYLVEDDYIHCRGAKKVLLEAFTELGAPYVTLYDHPDKYQDKQDPRYQSLSKYGKVDIDENGIRKPINVYPTGEDTVLYASSTCHWKLTSSTTMTFATTAKNIIEDKQDMLELHTGKTLPMGGVTFKKLASKGKGLLSPIPSYSTHAEERWLSYFVNWKKEAL